MWYDTLKRIYQADEQQWGPEDPANERIERCYDVFYETHQEDLAHYFRTLYHLIKLVKFSEAIVEYKDKRRYTSLARAQLSAFELTLLFYDGASKHGKGFKPWIEEFGLLEHINKDHLLLPSHAGLYSEAAYK